MNFDILPTTDDVLAAHARIGHLIHETPVMRANSINALLDSQLFFKCEHLQLTGSFKIRGASNAILQLPSSCRGVASHSSGNHGAALAHAAMRQGLAAHIVVPENAVLSKREAIVRYGGQVHACTASQAAREAGLDALIEQGFEPVPPYDDHRVIAGQGSCALELLSQVPDLDLIVAPVGGGGLISGTALAALSARHSIEVIGIEPAGADDTARSLALGARVEDHQPETMADGLRALVGQRNLQLIRQHVTEVLTVSEDDIRTGMAVIWSRLKQVVEPSGAVALAGLVAHRKRFAGRRIGVILSGGNLDLAHLFRSVDPEPKQ